MRNPVCELGRDLHLPPAAAPQQDDRFAFELGRELSPHLRHWTPSPSSRAYQRCPCNRGRITLDGGAVHDLTAGIDDADRGLLHGNVEADVVLLPHGVSWGLDRSAIMPSPPPRETPRMPHLAFSLLAHRPALTVIAFQ